MRLRYQVKNDYRIRRTKLCDSGWRLFVTLIFSTSLVYCGESNGEKSFTREPVSKDLPSNLADHDSLTTQQAKDVKKIHSVFSEVSAHTFAETINYFSRSQSPDNEIAKWLKMARAYERFTLNKHVEEHDQKEEAFQLLKLRSTMDATDALDQADITYLTIEQAKEILGYYSEPPSH